MRRMTTSVGDPGIGLGFTQCPVCGKKLPFQYKGGQWAVTAWDVLYEHRVFCEAL